MKSSENKSRMAIDVVGRDLTAARQDYPELWDSDDTPEGNRESQIPMRHGQAVKTALKKLATIQTIQRIERAFEATVGSVFREGLRVHSQEIEGWSRYAFFAQVSPCSVDSKRTSIHPLRSEKSESKIIRKNFGVFHG